MNINLNDEFAFTITEDGLSMLLKLDRKWKLEPGSSAKLWRFNKTTNRCEAPLYSIMNVFGPCMFMGAGKKPILDNSLTPIKAPVFKALKQETITWITDGSSLPDSDITVLLCTDVGDVGEAFHDGDDWRWVNSDAIGTNRVKAWAGMPEGPTP